jgi:hypothetical protein
MCGMANGADIEKAYALIIGISEYKDPGIRRLNYTHADAEELFELLKDPNWLGLKEENIKVLLDEAATRFNIRNAFTNWLYNKADEDSIVFIFFAGHGHAEQDRTGIEKDNIVKYLLPYDTVVEDIYNSAISNREFHELLQTIRSKKLVIFMDSCYSGGVSVGADRDIAPMITDDPYKKLGEGEGRIVIAASLANQRSYEHQKIKHGVFTYNLLKALKGGADQDSDGYVKVLDAFKYLDEKVPKTAMELLGFAQKPIMRGTVTNDIVISINKKYFEKIEKEKTIQGNISKLLELRNQKTISGKEYARLSNIVKTDFEKLSDKDKKIASLMKDFLSDYFPVTAFLEDMKIIDPELFETPENERHEQERLRRQREEEEKIQREKEREKALKEEEERKSREKQLEQERRDTEAR